MARKGTGTVSRAALLRDELNSHLKHAPIMLGNDPKFTIHRIDTGSLAINRITGGGIAKGRHTELFGDESTGKSAIMLRTMALRQQVGELCALVDCEHSFDEEWFTHLGGDPDSLLLYQPERAEEVVKLIMLLCGSRDEPLGVVGIDSVSALVPMDELEKDPTEGQSRIAAQARLMSEALRRITPFMDDTAVLWSNQLRTNIGNFYDPDTTSGGRALRFYATTRIRLKKSTRRKRTVQVAKAKTGGKGLALGDAQMPDGYWVECLSIKDKSTMPHMQSRFFFDQMSARIDPVSEIMVLGLEDGIIERSGNTFSYDCDDGSEISGLETKFREELEWDDDLQNELMTKIEARTIQLGKPGRGEDDSD